MSRRMLCIVCAAVLLVGVIVAPASGADASAGKGPATADTATAVTASATDDTFPGDSVSWHPNVSSFAVFTDNLTLTTDEDDYRTVYLEVGEYYDFTLTPDPAVDFDLLLYDPAGTYVNGSGLGVGHAEVVPWF